MSALSIAVRKDLRLFSTSDLSTGQSWIGALGISLVSQSGHGKFYARLRRFSISTSERLSGQLLSYGDAGTRGNVSFPVVVGRFGGWSDFKFVFAGRNVSNENR